MSGRKLYSIDGLTELLTLSRATINRLRADKKFPPAVYPTGNKVLRWKAKDIDDWIDSLEKEVVKETKGGKYDPFDY